MAFSSVGLVGLTRVVGAGGFTPLQGTQAKPGSSVTALLLLHSIASAMLLGTYFEKMRSLSVPVAIISLLSFFPVNVYAYDSKAHTNAAAMIAASCMWWQVGKIQRSQIMSFAKEQYRKEYGNPNNVNWNTAIAIAEKVDKQKGLGCFQ